jgi:SSS family transporter
MLNSGFNPLDFIVLIAYLAGLMIVATRFIKEQHNATDFFVASRSMPWWAVGMSILATLVSAISITGAPAEFFKYGLQGFGIWWLATFIAAPIIIYIFIHFFVGLKLITAYEYLERRFSLPIRLVGSVFFMLMRGLYIGVVLYASAIILVPAMGGSVSVIPLIVVVGAFSAAYAVAGGMKAVIWTDVIQLVIVYVGVSWLMLAITFELDGGFGQIWGIAVENHKDFGFMKDPSYWSFDIFKQNAFWLLLVGSVFNALSQKGTDQLTVQRYLTTGNVKDSSKALMVDVIGAVPMGLLLTLVGMGLYAYYQTFPEQIDLKQVGVNGVLPHYIITKFPHGVAGLFIAAIMAAIMSTVDSGMNCLATVTMTDLQLRFRKEKMSDEQTVLWARIWTIVWAVICTALAIFIYLTSSDTVMRVSGQVLGLFSGSLLGIFLLGMLVPRANSWGAGIGAILGAIVAIWANYFLVKTMPDGTVVHVSYVVPIIFGTITTLAAGWGSSYFFPSPKSEQLEGLTYWHWLNKKNKENQ